MLVDDPVEKASVEAVLGLRGGGMTIRAIVAEMNRRGVSTRDGGRWHIASVQRVLNRWGDPKARAGTRA
jgi:hypothetical protein